MSAANLQSRLADTLSSNRDDQEHFENVCVQLSLALAHVPDNQFLTDFALCASKTLGADVFIISRLNPYSNLMRTVRFVVDGEIKPAITYSLDGTPCAHAIGSGVCVYKDNVASLFPHDKFLSDFGLAGYAGTRLVSSSGEPLGVVLALTRKPISDETIPRKVLEKFQARVASAVETAETMDRYSWAIAEATDGIWDWDVVTGGTTVSKGLEAMLGYDAKKGPYDLSQIEESIHPDERRLHTEALQKHLSDNAPFDVTIRLRDCGGAYRWFRSRGKAVRNAAGKPVRMIGCFNDIHDLTTKVIAT